MAITRLFASIIPAMGVNHTVDQKWNVFGIYSKIVVDGDQVDFPSGIVAHIRFTIEGAGRIDSIVRFRNANNEVAILDHPFTVDCPPETKESTITCFDMVITLPINRLYPSIAASSIGMEMQTTFLMEVLVPRSLVDPTHQDEDPLKPEAAVLAASPIFLICRPPTPTTGTAP